MKYYAVTEDPNELFHYGRLGMKWGQHIFGDKPKSPGYKRALGKLRASKAAGTTKQTAAPKVNKSTIRAQRKVQREQEKYRKAVQKTQRNIEIVENLHNIDNARQYERGIDKDYWRQVKAARVADKQQRKYDRVELKMDKYMQKARQGKLKYGKLSDGQVQRVTERLAMEKNARQLGSAEKTWHQQKKEAFRKGKLLGIEKGTAASMEELARAGTRYGIQNYMNRKKLNAVAKQTGKEERLKSREKNKKSKRDMREDFKAEVYEERVREGQVLGTKHDAKNLRKLESDKHERLRAQNLQDRLSNERDEKWSKYLDEKGLTEKEALKLYGGKLKDSDKKSEIIRNEENYKKAIEDAAQNAAFKNVQQELQRRLDNDAIEARNAEREQNFINDMKEYKENVEYNKAEEAKYKAKMNEYDQKMESYREELRMWTNNPTYRSSHDKPIKPDEPSKPKFRDVSKKPKREDYGFESLHEESKMIPTSYDEFERYRKMGVNMGSMFGNNGGKGKKK